MNIKSDRVQKALELSNTQFKRLFGVKKETFERMLEILEGCSTWGWKHYVNQASDQRERLSPSPIRKRYEMVFGELHKRGGKPLTKLQIEDKFLLTLQYWREYRTMEHLGYEYSVVKSAVHSSVVGWKTPSFAMEHSVCPAKIA